MLQNLKGRDLLTLKDFSADEIDSLLTLAMDLKKAKKNGTEIQHLKGKSIALIFEKNSTRTRVGFEIAAYDQGAHVTYLGPSGSQIGTKESMKDTAQVLGRLYDGIEYRGFDQATVEVLAQYAGVPVFNGLTNEYHPTQILADFLTMMEHSGKDLHNTSFCYIGDARNNMGHSLMLGGAKMGMDVRICAPTPCQPEYHQQQVASKLAGESGARLLVTEHIEKAVKGCDFIYTDVWVSMGEPEDAWEKRINLLLPYQVNKQVLDAADNPLVGFMHCLPAFHNTETVIGKTIHEKFGIEAMEVTDEVFESRHSVVFDQAENRMHTIKAVLVSLLSDMAWE